MTSASRDIARGNPTAFGLAADRDEILRGLTAPQKRLPPKYFYDKCGSELFDRVCSLPEYYLTRTELELMRQHLAEVAALVGERVSVIEFGAGSSAKVRLLLDHLRDPAAYVPVDISSEFLLEQVVSLRVDYPNVQMQPVFADFTLPFELPIHAAVPKRNLVFFPGSTIGNSTRRAALELLEVMASTAKPGGALLIGVDLEKDPAVLHAAYNDAAGVTAEFNLNLLTRLNRELDAEFDRERFEHQAVYDRKERRIEMRLISSTRQRVNVGGVPIDFAPREYIITEYSHKYASEDFRALAKLAGFVSERTWIDDARLFSLHYMTVPPSSIPTSDRSGSGLLVCS